MTLLKKQSMWMHLALLLVGLVLFHRIACSLYPFKNAGAFWFVFTQYLGVTLLSLYALRYFQLLRGVVSLCLIGSVLLQLGLLAALIYNVMKGTYDDADMRITLFLMLPAIYLAFFAIAAARRVSDILVAKGFQAATPERAPARSTSTGGSASARKAPRI